MSPPPRSRTSSRPATPIIKSSPSKLVVPFLRPTHSLSNLHIHSHKNSPTASSTNILLSPPNNQQLNSVVESSASSMSNMDMADGILVQDVDVEVDTVEGDVMGRVETHAGDESSKKTLRDQLRQTLSKRQSTMDSGSLRARQKGKQVAVDEISYDWTTRYPPREYFILTDAGKPVFISRPGREDDGTSAMGIMQALISVFLDDNDKLRCINAGNTRITFLLRSPLYYVCASSWGEPESVTRSHLEYLHLQILSVVTASQLRRIFERRTNFDLRRLLNGAESFLTSLLGRLEFDPALSTSSLHCLRLDPNVRKKAAEALVPTSKMKDVLYVILIARGRVVTLVRPKKHSIHPADIHILLNTIHAPSILDSPASSSWIPVCLPKFNPSGFVNAYISFLRKDDGRVDHDLNEERGWKGMKEKRRTSEEKEEIEKDSVVDVGNEPGHGGPQQKDGEGRTAEDRAQPVGAQQDSGIALICISGGAEFEVIRGWCDQVTLRLEEGSLDAISTAFRTGLTEYSVAELGIPGLRHFVYKSRAQVQITAPVFEEPYDDLGERRRLTTLYQILHDAIHGKSGQEGTLKLQYIQTEKDCVMGWITQPFELYITVSPRLPKTAAVGAANAVSKWVKKEEARLFLRDAPVF